MYREPWIHFCGPKDLLASKAILDSLSDNGVVTQSLDLNAPADHGIICFSRVDDDLYDFVREVSHNKAKRVLLVPLDSTQLDSAQAWRLLHAGASDVFLSSSASEAAERVKARFKRWRVVDDLLQTPIIKKNLIGGSPDLAIYAAADRRSRPLHQCRRSANWGKRYRKRDGRTTCP
jgi:hypothetical protein